MNGIETNSSVVSGLRYNSFSATVWQVQPNLSQKHHVRVVHIVHAISVTESADRSEIGEKHLKPPKSTPRKRQSDNADDEGDCTHCHAFTRGPRPAKPCHETIRGARGRHHTERHRPCGGRRGRPRRWRRCRSVGCWRRRRGRSTSRPWRRRRGECASRRRRWCGSRSRRGTRKSRHNSFLTFHSVLP